MTEHDPIEAILKATGRRPPVAAERAERCEASLDPSGCASGCDVRGAAG